MADEFGRNQVQVDQLLERLEKADQGDALFLAAFDGGTTARSGARDAMLEAAKRGGRERELGAAQHRVTRWVNTWFSGGFEIAGYGRDVTPAEAAVNAAPAVLDAIGALVVGDLLSTDDVETLMGPWRELTGDHPAGSETRGTD